jgi:hypothetical protein
MTAAMMQLKLPSSPALTDRPCCTQMVPINNTTIDTTHNISPAASLSLRQFQTRCMVHTPRSTQGVDRVGPPSSTDSQLDKLPLIVGATQWNQDSQVASTQRRELLPTARKG